MDRDPSPEFVVPTRFVSYVFDDVSTDVADLVRSREAAVKQLNETMDPETRVAIYSASGTTHLDFTGDIDAVITAMRGIRRWSADVAYDCPPLNYYWANQIINQANDIATNAAMTEYMSCHPPSSGDAVETVRVAVRGLAYEALNRGQRETGLALAIVEDVSRRMASLPGERIIVYVSSGFYVEPTWRFQEQKVMDAAVAAKVSVNSLDARGVYVVSNSSSSTMTRVVLSPALLIFHDSDGAASRALIQGNVLGELAQGTGGTFISNTNGYEQAFRRLTANREPSYTLSFAPSGLKYDGKYHDLKVKLVPRPGLDVNALEVSARAGYFAPTAANAKAQTSSERIREEVFAREEATDLPLDLKLEFSRAPLSVEARVNVDAKIGVEQIHFRKVRDRSVGVMTLVSAAFDRNGNYVKGIQKDITLKLTDDLRDKFFTEGVNINTELLLPPGGYLVRVVVRDSDGVAIGARNGSVEIPF